MFPLTTGLPVWAWGRLGRRLTDRPAERHLNPRAKTAVAELIEPGGSLADWATESLMAARQAYHDPATGRRIKAGAKLGEAYQAAGLPVAKRRLYQAGVRLAMVLNEALTSH